MASAFEIYLRTGRRVRLGADAFETKFNPWHDPGDGRFTFAGQGRYFPSASNRADAASKRREAASTSLRTTAAMLNPGESRLVAVGDLKIVQLGPSVHLVPVAITSVEEFSAGTAQASRMFKLDAIITGPQFDLFRGSAGLQGQVTVNGRIFGNSAKHLYYVGTVPDRDGGMRMVFGKGDPPSRELITGVGGAVPLLIEGRSVAGYSKAWRRYSESDKTGKNILAYSSKRNTSALFIQPDGVSGTSLEAVRHFIIKAGYDYAVMFDGSGSTSLRFRGKSIVSPNKSRETIIPLAIGLASQGR